MDILWNYTKIIFSKCRNFKTSRLKKVHDLQHLKPFISRTHMLNLYRIKERGKV